MSLSYSDFVATIANLTALDATSPEFVQILPQAIQYAEDRIYRELDLLNTVYVNDTSFLSAGNRNFTMPAAPYGSILTVLEIDVIPSSLLQRKQLQPVSPQFLNSVWGTPANATIPEYFAMIKQDAIIVGPWPDQNYRLEIYGTFQPEPLSATNTTTQLTVLVPDLFTAAAMIFMSGYMRDFGSQSDNPQQSQSWQNQYDLLFKSAQLLELRKKLAGPGWTAFSSVPVTPSR